MQDLKNTTIGGKSITLKRVPARDARHIQIMLMAAGSDPLVQALGAQSTAKSKKSKEDTQGEQILAGLRGITGILYKLKDGELDNLIDKCKPFILVDGKPFDENEQFDADSLFDMYEVLWYFLKETFGGFISATLLRFPEAQVAMASLKK